MKITQINPTHALAGRILPDLKAFNESVGPKVNYQPVAFVVEEEGEFLGGLDGYLAWDYLEISNLIIHKKQQGLGTKLMAYVEDMAKKNGAKKMILSTLDFQAPEFYKKLGFKVFGELTNIAGQHTQYYMVKEI